MIYLPSPTARPSPVTGWIHRLFAGLRKHALNRRDRQAFKNLLSKDDAILRDIGVTRAEVEQAAALPLSQNAAQELRRIALSRR